MESKGELYQKLWKAFQVTSDKDRQKQCNDYWATIKSEPNVSELVESKLAQLQQSQAKTQPSITSFSALSRDNSAVPQPKPPTTQSPPVPVTPESQSKASHFTPKQAQLQAQIAQQCIELEKLQKIRVNGWFEDAVSLDRKIGQTEKSIKELRGKLKKLEQNKASQKRFRLKQRRLLETIQEHGKDDWATLQNEDNSDINVGDFVENQLIELPASKATSSFALPHSDSAVSPKPTIQSPTVPFPPKSQCEPSHSNPKQEQLQGQIALHVIELEKLENIRDNGWVQDAESLNRKISQLKKGIKELRSKLKKRESNTASQQRYRLKQRRLLETIQQEHPDQTIIRATPGRPPIKGEEALLKEILEIVDSQANSHSQAADRPRADHLETSLTLDALQRELKSRNIAISRTSLYRRLLPRCSHSKEGQRHLNPVPVRLSKASSASAPKEPHTDAHLC